MGDVAEMAEKALDPMKEEEEEPKDIQTEDDRSRNMVEETATSSLSGMD